MLQPFTIAIMQQSHVSCSERGERDGKGRSPMSCLPRNATGFRGLCGMATAESASQIHRISNLKWWRFPVNLMDTYIDNYRYIWIHNMDTHNDSYGSSVWNFIGFLWISSHPQPQSALLSVRQSRQQGSKLLQRIAEPCRTETAKSVSSGL